MNNPTHTPISTNPGNNKNATYLVNVASIAHPTLALTLALDIDIDIVLVLVLVLVIENLNYHLPIHPSLPATRYSTYRAIFFPSRVSGNGHSSRTTHNEHFGERD